MRRAGVLLEDHLAHLLADQRAFLVGQAVDDQPAVTLARLTRAETQVGRRNRLVIEQARVPPWPARCRSAQSSVPARSSYQQIPS